MHGALDPSGGRVAIPNDGNVAMRLLAAAWRQKKPAPGQLCRKGAATYQTQVMLPFHHKCAIAPSCMPSFWSLPVCSWSVKRRWGGATNTGVAPVPGARCENTKGWRPWSELVSRGKVRTWPVCTSSVLQVVIRTNTAANTVPSGHVQRAPYILPYFRLSLWSSILWRPLRGEHSSTHFAVRRLTVATPRDG